MIFTCVIRVIHCSRISSQSPPNCFIATTIWPWRAARMTHKQAWCNHSRSGLVGRGPALNILLIILSPYRQTGCPRSIDNAVTLGPLYQHGLTLISVWINNYIHNEMLDEITYPSHTSKVDVWKWISNFITQSTGHVITYPVDLAGNVTCWL